MWSPNLRREIRVRRKSSVRCTPPSLGGGRCGGTRKTVRCIRIVSILSLVSFDLDSLGHRLVEDGRLLAPIVAAKGGRCGGTRKTRALPLSQNPHTRKTFPVPHYVGIPTSYYCKIYLQESLLFITKLYFLFPSFQNLVSNNR